MLFDDEIDTEGAEDFFFRIGCGDLRDRLFGGKKPAWVRPECEDCGDSGIFADVFDRVLDDALMSEMETVEHFDREMDVLFDGWNVFQVIYFYRKLHKTVRGTMSRTGISRLAISLIPRFRISSSGRASVSLRESVASRTRLERCAPQPMRSPRSWAMVRT